MKKCIAIVSAVLLGAQIFAAPAAVFIVRHGEKQLQLNPQGIPEKKPNGGPVYTKYLSDRGWQRAHAISFDMTFYNNSQHGVPVACFGSAPSKATGSLRPIETITPLAKRLGLKVVKNFLPTAHQKVADYVKNNKAYNGKLVVMAWEHHNIPALAKAFGATQAPTGWANNVFDRIWKITFDTETGDVLSFENAPQQLLYGDSAN